MSSSSDRQSVVSSRASGRDTSYSRGTGGFRASGSHSFASIADRNRQVLESLRGMGDMTRYADNNIANLIADVRGAMRSPDRRLHLAKVVSTYLACNQSAVPWPIFDQLLRMMVPTPLVRGTLKSRMHPKAVLRGDVRRFRRLREGFEDAMDADSGLYRAALSQLCRMLGVAFYYSTAKTLTLLQLAHREEMMAMVMETERVQRALADYKERRDRAVTAQGRDSETLTAWVARQEGAVMMVDKRGNIVALTEPLWEMFGHTRDSLLGKDVHQLTPAWLRATHQTKVDSWFRQPASLIGRRVQGAMLDGTEIEVELNLDHVDAKVEHFVVARLFECTARISAMKALEATLTSIMTAMASAKQPVMSQVLAAAAPARLLLVDEESHISFCSESASALLGVPRETVVAGLLDDIVPVAMRQRHQMLVRQFFRRDSYMGVKSYVTTSQGARVPVILHSKRVNTVDGPRALACIQLQSEPDSVWERVNALVQERLVTEDDAIEARFQQQAMEAVHRDFLPTCTDLEAIFVSKLGCIMAATPTVLGYTEEELVFQPVDMLTPDDVADTHWQRVQSFFTNPAQLGGRGRVVRARLKSGETTRVLLALRLIEFPEGPMVLGTVRMMEQSLAALAEVREELGSQVEMRTRTEELDLKSVSEAVAPHALLICGQDGIVRHMSERMCDVTGYSAEEVVGNNVSMLTPEFVRHEHDRKIKLYFIEPRSRTLERTRGKQPVQMSRKDGELLQVSVTLNVAKTRWGKTATCVIMSHQNLQQHREAVEEEHIVEEEEMALNGQIMADLHKNVGWWKHAEG